MIRNCRIIGNRYNLLKFALAKPEVNRWYKLFAINQANIQVNMPIGPLITAILPLGYLLSASLSAGLLAYPLHWFLQDSVSFRAVVSRGTLVLILLSLPWIMTRLNLKRSDLGLPTPARLWFQGLTGGLLVGIAIMALLVLLEAALGLRAGIWSPGQFVDRLLEASAKPLLIGVLVGCIEELLFRGVLLGALAKYRGSFYAIAISAFYYAALHFYHSSLKLPTDSLDWSSGLIVVWDGFMHLFNWNHLDSFAALYCAGLLLGCLRLLAKPGLALCIGVHTGWVYSLRTSLALTDMTAASPWRFLVGDYDHIIGWLAAVWLALLTVPLLLMLHKRTQA